jgi:hypothetical protein
MILILAQSALSRKRGIYLAPSLLRFSFLLKSKLVARKQGRCAEKASAQLFRIADCGFIWFSFSIRIPQSAFRIY